MSFERVKRSRVPADEVPTRAPSLSKLPRIATDSLCLDIRCIYASLEEMVVLLKALLQQVGARGFLTKTTTIDWKQISEILGKSTVDCEFLFWNFHPRYFRKSLNLIVMEFDPNNVMPPCPDRDKEVNRFNTLVSDRMKQLLRYLDEPDQRTAPTKLVTAARPHPPFQAPLCLLDQGVVPHQSSSGWMGFVHSSPSYFDQVRPPQAYPFLSLSGQFTGPQYMRPFQIPQVSQFGHPTQHLQWIADRPVLYAAQTAQDQYLYYPPFHPAYHQLSYSPPATLHTAMPAGLLPSSTDGRSLLQREMVQPTYAAASPSINPTTQPHQQHQHLFSGPILPPHTPR